MKSVWTVRRHEVRTLHIAHCASEVTDVEQITNDDIGALLAKLLGTLVFSADHRPNGESGTEQLLGDGAAGIACSRGDENSGLGIGHSKTPDFMNIFTFCFIL
jgi:hypothetical protein